MPEEWLIRKHVIPELNASQKFLADHQHPTLQRALRGLAKHLLVPRLQVGEVLLELGCEKYLN